MKHNLMMMCLLSGLSLPVWGQSTLDDCIRYAWKHNPNLKSAYIDRKEARTDYVSAIGKFLPEISVQAEVGRQIGRSVDPDTNGYTTNSYNQGTVGLDVTLSLFEGFVRVNRLRYAHYTEKEKEWEYMTKRNELAYQVVEAYYKAILNEKLSELASEQLRLGEHYLKQTETYVELGLKSVSDLREIKARYQGDVFKYHSYEKNRRLSFLYLKEILGMEEKDSLSISLLLDESSISQMPSLKTEEIYVQSIHMLPDYKRMEMWEQAARREYATALGLFSPTVFARLSWRSNYYNSLFSIHQLNDHWNKYIGIGVSFSIFNRLDRYAGVKKKKLTLQRVRNSIEEEKLHLRNETEQLVLSLYEGWEQYKQVTLQVDAETQVMKETERKWEEGLVSVFQLMETRNRLLATKAEKISTRLQHELLLRLAMYYQTGKFIND
ncbi:TolC family protein [Phocaeicola sp.]|uniref:TolC family protein n=1 Tax=Phocaeicola sp. TaxID=2773926 RepID=UPI0023BF308F|nr:TolC family protein [Phocaeicola sp.]MDE5676579.1 TolC family protein [Phocaeicola sp.]